MPEGRSRSIGGSYRVCFPFVGDTLGGSHLSSIELIRELLKNGTDVLVVLHQSGPLEKELLRLRLEFKIVTIPKVVRHFRRPSDVVQLIQSVARLGVFCKREKIQIIHTNDGRIHVTWGLVAALFRRDHVWHQRTVFFPSRTVEFFLRRAKRIICISDFVQKSLPANLRNRSIVLANLIGDMCVSETETKRIRAKLTTMSTYFENVHVVGTFGNLTDVKDPCTSVRALSEYVKTNGNSFLLCYFGEDRGGFREKIEKIAKENNVFDLISFIGFQRPIANWISACDLVLAPSVCDAFGRTILEAMEVGVPVVAANAGGHRELIRHGYDGVLVEPRNPKALADAIAEVLEQSEFRNTLVRRGKKKIRSSYDQRTIVRSVESLYSNLLS